MSYGRKKELGQVPLSPTGQSQLTDAVPPDPDKTLWIHGATDDYTSGRGGFYTIVR